MSETTPLPYWDDPETDGTDFAHPAWWRGEKHGAHSICRGVNEVLDGEPAGAGVAGEPWEGMRRRLRARLEETGGVITLIKTAEQYSAALAELSLLVDRDPAAGTPDSDRLELLAVLVEHYEKQRWQTMQITGTEAILFRMEQRDLRPVDLAPLMGVARNRVGEVLSGHRQLSKAMIRNLSQRLQIPAEVLLMDNSPSPPPAGEDG